LENYKIWRKMMKYAMYKRNETFLLTTVAILLILLTIGCLQSNNSKIIGSWKSQSINNKDGTVQYTSIKFYKEGLVSRKDVIIANDEVSKKNNKIIGKYMFNEDKNRIKITWDNGNSEIMNVSFPNKNKMLLGKYEMEKTK